MRGDVYDGRNFVKTAMAGPADPKVKAQHPDLDLDIKIGVVAGHLRRDGPRPRLAHVAPRRPRPHLLAQRQDRPRHAADRRDAHARQQRQAGALFRDQAMPARCSASPTSISAWSAARCGSAWIRRRRTRRRRKASSTSATSRSAAKARSTAWCPAQPNGARSEQQHRFLAGARRLHPRAGPHVGHATACCAGRCIGATVEGNIDYARDQVHMRGTLVPLYGLNNMFGQIPIVGLFLGGGSNEGMFGITYEVTGPPPIRARGQSDLGDRAGRAAQVLRVPRDAGARPRLRADPTRLVDLQLDQSSRPA